MFQQFNTDTLVGRVIKNILATTPVPIFNPIDEGDIVVKNCFYIYKHYIIKVLSTGTFFAKDQGHFYPGYIHGAPADEDVITSNWIPKVDDQGRVFYEQNPDWINGQQIWTEDQYNNPASYQVVNHDCTNVGLDSKKYMRTYHSTSNYYDSDTHYHLGDYLRYYKATTGINLLPYYNCYTGQTLDNVVLHEQDIIYGVPKQKTTRASLDDVVALGTNYGTPSYSVTSDINKKCYAVPIKFGKQYTVAIDSVKPVILRPIVYKDGSMVRASNSLVYSDYPELEAATMSYSKTEFRKPFRFSVNTHRYDLKQRERYLLLVVQVDSNVDSTLTVLEGDYTHSVSRAVVSYTDDGSIDRSVVYTDTRTVIQHAPQALSLLQINSRETYAFSDRLVEYLLQNVIDSETQQENNLKRIQDIVRIHDPEYDSGLYMGKYHYGTWDDRLPAICLELLRPHSNYSLLWDQDGNINKDLEKILVRGF